MKKQRDPNNPKLPVGKFLAWKSSDVTSAGVFWIINSYMMIFCTTSLGIAPALAGTILLIANIIDLITDFVIGYLMDKAPVTKLGKYRPFELGIFGVTIFAILLFCCPFSANTMKIIWVFVIYTLLFGVFNTARAGANLPYQVRAFGNSTALVGKVLALGGFVTTMGAAVITLTFPKLIAAFSTDGTAAGLTSDAWRKLILIFMIPLTVIAAFRFFFVKEDPEIDAGQQSLELHLSDVWKMIITNPYIWAYGLMIFAFQVVQNTGAQAYYFDYIVGSQESMGTISLFSYFLMPLLLLMPLAFRKAGATRLIIVTGIIAIGGYVINFFAGKSMMMLIIGALLTAFVTLPVSYLGGVLQMYLFNYNEYKGLPRQEATTNAIASGAFTQLGQGFGPFFAGLVLQWSGFNTPIETVNELGETVTTVLEQPASALTAVRLLYSLVPAIMMVLIIVAMIWMRKLEKKSPEIEAELHERHQAVIGAKEEAAE